MANCSSLPIPDPLTNPIMLAGLTTEQRNPISTYIDLLSTEDMLKIVNFEDAKVASAVALEIPKIALAIDAIADRMVHHNGRLMYIGAGTSGRLGVIDASECPPTFNISFEQVQGFVAGGDRAIRKAVEGVEDSAEEGRNDIKLYGITRADALVGIAASGRTPYVIGALDYACQIGAFTIGLACNKGTPMEQHVNVMISPVSGPEVVTGSTRMKAGTATKLVLNMLSTGVMVRIGKTYSNLMIDMRPSNYKLQLRAVRIVKQALDGRVIDPNGVELELDDEKAKELLNKCDKEVKLAILVGKTAMSPDDARQLLRESNGVLSKAIKTVLRPTLSDLTPDIGNGEELYLAVDGGGTKTLAVIVNKQGRKLGSGIAGSSNFSTVGLEAVLQSIATAVQGALTEYCSPKTLEFFPRFNAIWIGLAGVDRPNERAILVPEFNNIFSSTNPANIILSNDIDLLTSLIPTKRPGVALIAGTGSIAISYDADGRRKRRVGGWGYVLADEGSGYAIGLAASRAVTRILDGREIPEDQPNGKPPKSASLLTRVMKYWGCETAGQYISVVYGKNLTDADRKIKFAGLAPIVFEAYSAGDRIAARIIEAAAESISELLSTCLRDFTTGPEQQKVTLVIGGGLMVNWECYRVLVLANVRKEVGGDAFDEVVMANCPAQIAAEALAKKS